MGEKLRPFEILAEPKNLKCTCPDAECRWHGNCRDCIALHRYYAAAGDCKTPNCLKFYIENEGGSHIMPPRIGTGYDVHRLTHDRPLVLGGVTIPHHQGLQGHSDADVLTHAIMDALLGAAGLGDIGRHFPDTDPAYKGASSLCLLEEVGKLLAKEGWQPANIDATIIAQAPKLSPYREEMQTNIAKTLNIPPTAVNIKATTEEGLGFTGTGQGIAAQAVCLIQNFAYKGATHENPQHPNP